MDEIKVGEWVRTDDGRIYQVDNLEDEWLLSDKLYNKIEKHSENIIDLIEVGDYVNGKKIIKTYLEGATHYIKYEYYDGTRIYNEDIKSIVTKEQFSSVEYRLEE